MGWKGRAAVVTSHPDLRAIDGPEGADRRAALEHIRECDACRSELLTEDPARVFSLLALVAMPPRDLGAVSAAVERRLEAAPRTLLDALREGFFPRAAAAVAAIVLVGVGTVAFWPRPRLGDEIATRVAAPPAGAEVTMAGGDARVVDLAVGDIQVVMIFDPEIEL